MIRAGDSTQQELVIAQLLLSNNNITNDNINSKLCKEECMEGYGPKKEHVHYWRPIDLRSSANDIRQMLNLGDPDDTQLNRLIHRLGLEIEKSLASSRIGLEIDRATGSYSSRGEHRLDEVLEIRALCRSEYGYVDRNQAYRRLKDWQKVSGWGERSRATVMACQDWRNCSAPLA